MRAHVRSLHKVRQSSRRSSRIAPLLLGVALVAVGCGSDETAEPTTTAAPASSTTTGSDGATQDQHTEGNIGHSADPATADRVVDVEMTEMEFIPATIEVKPGEIITFRGTNTGVVEHEMTVGDDPTHELHAVEMAQADHHHDHSFGGGVSVHPGETAEFTWQFPDNTELGALSFVCHVAGHWESGMEGSFS